MPPMATLRTGDVLGAYEILDLVNRGGMGEVHRALDRSLDREVAIKVLPEEFVADPVRAERFRRGTPRSRPGGREARTGDAPRRDGLGGERDPRRGGPDGPRTTVVSRPGSSSSRSPRDGRHRRGPTGEEADSARQPGRGHPRWELGLVSDTDVPDRQGQAQASRSRRSSAARFTDACQPQLQIQSFPSGWGGQPST